MVSQITKRRFLLILILAAAAALAAAPKNFKIWSWTISSPEIDWRIGKFEFRRDLTIKKGLDLQGGTQLVLKAETENIPEADRAAAMESARAVISRRVDLYGISESVVQTSRVGDEYRMIVELPGVTDSQQALQLLGQTAEMEFREVDPNKPVTSSATDSGRALAEEVMAMIPTGLTGKDLERAQVEFDQESGQPVVGLVFTPEGKEKFSQITKRNIGKRVGIFLDQQPLTAPVVQTPIVDGRAIISGGFTTPEAKQLVVNLNAGALPVGLAPVAQTQVGATLGEESVGASVKAGLVGLGAVALFMILVYRKLGLIADAALIIYGLITLAIYKLIPITLSLPGIAGFLLSIGMATDANILIFERTKEELRRGLKLRAAVEAGFGRAWDSIKDANAATLLTAFILYNPFDWKFLNTSGLVRGFALTLTIGILISLFTGIVVSRTLLRMFYVSDKQQATSNKWKR